MTTVRLVPMDQQDFEEYLAYAIPNYAQEKVRAGNWQPEEALHLAESDFGKLLPDGLSSSNNYLYRIEVAPEGNKVGMIWLAANPKNPDRNAFIYDFMVYEPYRRRGYATQALIAVEEKVKALGLEKILLHVFGHNQAALALYQKMGYLITNINMAKDLRE